MKRFVFSLQSVLNLRRHKELMAQQAVGKAVLDLQVCEQQIDDLTTEKDQTRDRLEKKVADGLTASLFNQYSTYITTLSYRIHQASLQREQLSKVLVEKRQILKQKSIEKKAMERLREKQKQAYAKEALLEEQKELDEISSLKSAREILNAS